MRSEHERLLDIMEAIERIEKYAGRGKEAFLQDELIQNWMGQPYYFDRRSLPRPAG